MFDVCSSGSERVFEAAGLIGQIITRYNRLAHPTLKEKLVVFLTMNAQQQQLHREAIASECYPLLDRLRTLNDPQFPCSVSIAKAIEDLQKGMKLLCENDILGGEALVGDALWSLQSGFGTEAI